MIAKVTIYSGIDISDNNMVAEPVRVTFLSPGIDVTSKIITATKEDIDALFKPEENS